jgi:type VI secretion system protein ImpC
METALTESQEKSPAQSNVETVLEGKLQSEASLLDDIISSTRLVRHEAELSRAKDLIGELVREALEGEVVIKKDLETAIDVRIAALDELISAQLNEVMHAPEFQKLEGSWRGLHYLVHQSETSTMLKIRLMNVSKDDLRKDLERASEFDQSALFKKVYEEEYGTFGGASYGALIGDYEFGRHPQDMSLLEHISHVAAAAHAPFFAAAHPDFLNLNSFTDLTLPRDLAKIFDTVEYVKWRSFRDSEDSRYVGLTMPRILMRLPYGPDTCPTESFNFKEHVDGTDHSKYLWGNAAYALGARLTDAFAKYGWCAAIRGVEGGGLVEGLPTHTFTTDEGDIALKCPTEIAITDRREKELSDLGLIPLVHCKATDYAAFFAIQSGQKAKKYDTDAANANARLSTQMQYMMAISRFAHYLKAMMRDKIGSFASRKNVEDYLNRWINNYVLGSDEGGQEMKAKYPLREARIDVAEVPGKPGVYKAIAFLRPHFQLDELTVSLRLVAELPKAAKQG